MSDTQHVSPVNLVSAQAVTSYLSLRDQVGGAWFLFVDNAGAPDLTRTRPAGIDLADRQVFSWLRWLSPNGTAWYIYPSTVGSLFFSTARPLGTGTGQVYPRWYSPNRFLWLLALSNAPALVTTPIEAPLTLAMVPHTVMACRTCRWLGHIDRSNARRDADGNPLLDRCPVDGSLFYPELQEEADEVWA